MTYTLHHGNCLDVLKTLPDNSIDSIVTDPPYGLAFMGKKWDYDVPSQEIWAECLRVLKPGGHLLAFAGTRTQHRMAVRIEDAGFEIRDMIAWVYGSGFPKSHNLKDEWQGWGTALKPALEPITVARKPLIGTVAENVLAHGTGALNIDGCRVATDDGASRARPPRTPNTILGGGKGTNLTASEHNETGRWPANLIHDGSDEVVAGFPETNSGGYPPEGGRRSQVSTYGKPTARGEQKFTSSYGSAARFFYCAKASKRDRDEGLDGFEVIIHSSQLNESGLWEKEEKLARLLMVMGNSHLKVIDVSGALSKSVTEWNTLLFGSKSTGQCQQSTTFTTKTESNSTTESKILSCFQNLLTNESTAAANFGMVYGGSLVENVEHGIQQIIITSAKTESALGVDPVASKTRLKISVNANRNNHVTVKPTDLMRYLCRLVTPPGGVVLDPFMGSGSTGKAAMLEGFSFIGCELSEEYAAIANARIKQAMAQSQLFESEAMHQKQKGLF